MADVSRCPKRLDSFTIVHAVAEGNGSLARPPVEGAGTEGSAPGVKPPRGQLRRLHYDHTQVWEVGGATFNIFLKFWFRGILVFEIHWVIHNFWALVLHRRTVLGWRRWIPELQSFLQKVLTRT